MLITVLVVIVLVVIFVVSIYNGLVRLKVQCDNAWSDIDVQLKRRYDLIPESRSDRAGLRFPRKRHARRRGRRAQ